MKEEMENQADAATAAENADAGVETEAQEAEQVEQTDAAEQSPYAAKEGDAEPEEDAGEAGEEGSELEKLQESLKAKEDQYLRLQAEYANYRRRTSKEKEELAAVVTQNLFTDMLPLMDNFDRAMAAENTDPEGFRKGVEMIFDQFQSILKKNGLEVIETEGESFDPNFHQAVMRVQNPELEEDAITQELQKGYMVKGHVIRPSMVQVVSNS